MAGALFKFCFGLRFGKLESAAQAQRRPERSWSETTIAVPQAEACRPFGLCGCRS
jgi:hypothetical protein